MTRVAREIREIIFIPQTAENVSSLYTSPYQVNVLITPLYYVNALKPSETALSLHVELNVETFVKPVYKSISQVNPIFEKSLEKSSFVTIVVDDVVSEPLTKETSSKSSTDQMTSIINHTKESGVELHYVHVDSVLYPPVETSENENVKPNVELVVDIPAEPCVFSPSQVDYVSDKVVELSSTNDSSAVFVGASAIEPPTKLIFHNPSDMYAEPDVGTFCV